MTKYDFFWLYAQRAAQLCTIAKVLAEISLRIVGAE